MGYWQDDHDMQAEFFDNLNRQEKESAGHMTASDIMMYRAVKKQVYLTYQCRTENGITDEERFIIQEAIGKDEDNFQQVVVENQYGQTYTINVNQLTKY